jgi:hypothetical protein
MEQRRPSVVVVALLVLGLLAFAPLPSPGGSGMETASATLDGEEVAQPGFIGMTASLPPLPEGDPERGAEGVRRSAIALADALEAVRLEDGSACPSERLQVVWTDPGPAYQHGALAYPVGPEPSAATTLVNGAVVCDGSTFSYMGFTARWALARWIVLDIPAPDFGGHDHGLGPLEDLDALVAVQSGDVDLTPLWTRRWDAAIEGYAPYVPQRICDPRPKSGTVAFTELVLGAHPETASWGISRACHLGGTSEHKEGRAWDWRVDAYDDDERAVAEAVVSWLMATDEYGNRHAMARRLGVMYVIWNRHIWSSQLHTAGWRPYRGASPHTDHVHISFAPEGAMARTSFWRGVPLQGLGMIDPFAGMPSAFPEGFSVPPARAVERDAEAAADRSGVQDRDSWERQREESASQDGGAGGEGAAGSDSGSTTEPSESTGTDDGGTLDDVLTAPEPSLDLEPALPQPSPVPIPQLDPSEVDSPFSDPLDDLVDLLDEELDDLEGSLEGTTSTLP